MDVSQAFDSLNAEVWGVWFLIGAALVFWMQAGFAMVEAGFTRAKNTGNIIMKNLMDFCIGTVMWFVIGASFMLSYTDPVTGEVSRGIWSFLGKPGFSVFTEYATFDFSGFVFNLVFCATTATIVSGAMAERTKFSTYCIYSAIISGLSAGSPAPFESMMPSGRSAAISSHVVYAGSTVTRQPRLTRERAIFAFAP